jgi:hypothetical protein
VATWSRRENEEEDKFGAAIVWREADPGLHLVAFECLDEVGVADILLRGGREERTHCFLQMGR